MHETLALSAPNRQIHRRKGQTCTHVYRPDNGDPTHRLMATNFEFFICSLDREPNRRPFSSRKPSRKCEAFDPRQLANSSFVKNSPFKHLLRKLRREVLKK